MEGIFLKRVSIKSLKRYFWCV